jgi:hypothetical protein
MFIPEQSQIDTAFNLAEHIAVRGFLFGVLVKELYKQLAKRRTSKTD